MHGLFTIRKNLFESLQPQCIRSANAKSIAHMEYTVNRFGMEQNKTDLDWRQIHYIKERLRSIYLHTFILPSIVTIEFSFPYPWYSEFGNRYFGFTFNIHDKSVPLQLGHFFFINIIDQGQNIKNINPRLGGVTVLLQLLQFIVAMLSQLLSL